ncbi:MAG: ABC-F family ATP-binding cassette domain-containing protein, partial [Succiniclasticum sp.]
MQLTVDKLEKSFGVQEVFKDVSFMIARGEKIGLVGVNGSGKSTLVKCLLQPEYADRGTISFEPGIRVGYVEQGFGSIGSESVWDFMLHANPEVLSLRRKLAELEQASATGDRDVLESYGRVTQRYEFLDGYHYEAKLKTVLFGLAFPEAMWEMQAASLSGGQKTRLLLAAALVSSPDFLLLDEPTNHLDIRMMEWLEGFLRDFKGGVLVVSHDRAFLDHVATRVLELEGGHLRSFTGNYTKYLAQKEILVKTEKAAYEAQQDYIAEQEAYIRRFKAGIKSKMARGRQSRLDRLERLEAPVENETFSLRLPKAPESADRVLILEHLQAGYGTNELVKDVDLVLRRGEKAGLIGPNGSGKTTLLRTILGEIPALGGNAKIGNRVKIGYFSQSYERLDPNQTLLDNFLTEYGMTEEQTRSLLGGMLFHGDDVFKEIGTLSGGQKARLVL